MNEQTESLLRELAEKLGTNSEYLWQTLLNQAPISGSFNILISIVLISFIVISGTIIKTKISVWKEEYDDFAIYAILLIYSCVVLIVGICAIDMLYFGITAFINPEFWAIKEILCSL